MSETETVDPVLQLWQELLHPVLQECKAKMPYFKDATLELSGEKGDSLVDLVQLKPAKIIVYPHVVEAWIARERGVVGVEAARKGIALWLIARQMYWLDRNELHSSSMELLKWQNLILFFKSYLGT